jgi:hypothetical protein
MHRKVHTDVDQTHTPLPDGLPDSDETVTDAVTLSHSVYVDVIACLTEIKRTLDTESPGYDYDSASDRPNPILLDDAVLVLQTMASPVKGSAPLHTQSETPAPVFFAFKISNNTQASGDTFHPQQPKPAEGEIINSLKKRTRCHACSR